MNIYIYVNMINNSLMDLFEKNYKMLSFLKYAFV